MLVGAAVCPHPPLLVPEMAGAAASELDDLRAACDDALRRLPRGLLVVVGEAAVTRRYDMDAAGSLRPYGLDLFVGDGPGILPLSLTIGRWLLERNGLSAVAFQAVAGDTPPQDCLAIGAELAATADRVALLIMGDGSVFREEKGPGPWDAQAVAFDSRVAQALGAGDAADLAALDPQEAAELQVAGRAPWQVLAGAVQAAPAHGVAAELLAHQSPYGVGYLVASWTAVESGERLLGQDVGG